MIPFLLSALGTAATSAGLSSLGAGLTAAGSTLGGAGAAGTAAGAAAPAAAPLGFSLSNLLPPATQNLGTGAGGWSTTVTPAATPGQQLMGQAFKELQKSGQRPPPQAPQVPMAPDPRNPQQVDFASLLQAINNRSRLGI